MSIRFVFIYLYFLVSQTAASCPYIRTSVILAECVFQTNFYQSLGANVSHSNAIDFKGYYSLDQQNVTGDHLRNPLIYNLGYRWMLLVPFAIKCAHQPAHLTFTECQYTMRQAGRTSSSSEYMTTQLSVMNMSDLGRQSVLFLQPGEITLRSCKAYDCDQQFVYLTASNETFHFQVNYERPLDSPCRNDADCEENSSSSSSLLQCNSTSRTCRCRDETMSTVELNGIGRLCADSIEESNCTKFSKRCLTWCNASETSHCLCPTLTRKVRKIDGLFDCELEPNSPCRFDDQHLIPSNIRKCPTGTFCDGERCRPLTIAREIHQDFFNESTLSFGMLLSTRKPNSRDQQTVAFIRTLIVIAIAILLFFILIILIIVILVTSHRCRCTSASVEDKVSSSSFAPSTSTGLSMDSTNHQQSQAPQTTISSVLFNDPMAQCYENYLSKTALLHGLVPQANLSPRFHRQQQALDDRRRIPLQIRSPSLTRINPFIDHASLATVKRLTLPKVTHLQNGDVVISA